MSNVFDDAISILRDREQSYGSFKINFARIAYLWEAYLNGKFNLNIKISPDDVADMMVLLKIARGMHVFKYDNEVDKSGYIFLKAELHE